MATRTLQTKEAIANRMFRNAAQIWDYNDTDLDSFDPLVRLIIEACAVEVYNINHDISNLQKRLLERLATLLTPEVHTSARPAHGILHARSLEPVTAISPLAQFFHHKKIASKPNGPLDSNLDLFFSPCGTFNLFDGAVKYIANGNNLYSVNEQQIKGSLFKFKSQLDPYTAWIGVEMSELTESLKGLSFYFDFKNNPNRITLLQSLHYADWNIEGKKVKTITGLWDAARKQALSDYLSGADEFKLTPNTELRTNLLYRQNFVSIPEDVANPFICKEYTRKYPEEFNKLLDEKDLASFDSKILWFKVKFPAAFSQQVLDDMTVNINCFPVLNRHLNQVRYRLQSFFNIIPLTTDEEFFDIKDVHNINGKLYTANPIEKRELSEKGTYSLRHSGVERFDKRDAREHLNYLTELLRDESNAFAAFGQDFISNLINEMNQNISKIEQKLNQNSNVRDNNSTFLFLKPYEEGENIFVEFWTCNGEEANAIRPGSRLECYSGNDINKEGVYLLTASSGGRDRIGNTELLTAYRNNILSRGRVVSRQDISNLCNEVMGRLLDKVEIRKGVAQSSRPGEGLIETVDVLLTPSDKKMEDDEWELWQREILSRLEHDSVVFTNYRVLKN